ncbi:hypothetical protein QR680_018721 [Steinernema hermaphroditum]|uniref:BTB domain-containing protein n=1 Tax=Steinernema hermaphroditum TaxID=289476 RepID=A0AA39LR65_9BILA|nr:hypothetical protein QR680_018721 [Steinernema hermaphroditum]
MSKIICRVFGPQYQYTSFLSDVHTIDEFKWYVSGEAWPRITYANSYCPEDIVRHLSIQCFPACDERTVFWECFARGHIDVSGGSHRGTVSKMWHDSFYMYKRKNGTNKKEHSVPSADLLLGHFLAPISELTIEVHVDVIRSSLIDISSPENELIANAPDAARFAIEDELVYVSKTVLMAHSHFFNVLFTGDFLEKMADSEPYSLTGIQLEEFMHFLAIIHGLKEDIDPDSVKYLLRLGDMWECRAVMNRCKDYLRSPDADMSFGDRILLADRHDFDEIVTDIVEQISQQELRMFVQGGHHKNLSRYTSQLLIERHAFH